MITKRRYPWYAEQTWRNIFFFHWPVDPIVLEKYIPKPLRLDIFAGKAWVSVVIFTAINSRFRNLPLWTSVPPVTQINFRTYVYPTIPEEKGVFFLSIQLNQFLAALSGKRFFNLPFQYVNMLLYQRKDTVKITCNDADLLRVCYKNQGELEEDGLKNFLMERYCIWNVKGNHIIKIPISHPKWTVQKLKTDVKRNELFVNFNLPRMESTTYYCHNKHAKLYPYEKFGIFEN